MTDIIRLSAWFIITVLAGWSVLTIVLYRKPVLFLPEKLALSYCIGLGLITLEMVLLSLFSIPFSAVVIASVWLPVFIAAVSISLMMRGMDLLHRRPAGGGRFSLPEKFFLSGIIFETCYAFFRALIKPIEAYDAIAIYALKAKAFYLAASIPHDFLKVLGDPVSHPEYPLLLPLAESSVYVFLGSLNDLLVKVIFPLYYAAILVILYYVLRRFVARKAALLFTFLLATIPHFNEYATTGYADLLLGAYYSASFFYLLLWIGERKTVFLVISFLLSGLGIWTKTEGLALAAVNMAVALIALIGSKKADIRNGIIFIAASVATISSFLYTKALLGLRVHENVVGFNWYEWFGSMMNIGRIPLILYELQIQFFGPKKWNIIWILFIAAFVLNFRKAFTGMLQPVTLALLLTFGAYISVYLITPQASIEWQISKTASRFLLHFVPVVVLWLAVLYKEEGAGI